MKQTTFSLKRTLCALLLVVSAAAMADPDPGAVPTAINYTNSAASVASNISAQVTSLLPYLVALLCIGLGPRIMKSMIKGFAK